MPEAQLTFQLKLDNLPSLDLTVIKFTGTSSLNSLFHFEVLTVANVEAFSRINKKDLFSSKVTLTFYDAKGSAAPSPGKPSAHRGDWHGIIKSFEVGSSVGESLFLTLVMEPSLSMLEGQIQNHIHLETNTLDIIKASLEFGGLTSNQYQFKCSENYPTREFVFQYEEDLLNFVFRNLEREGLALYYDQTTGHDVLTVADYAEQYPSVVSGEKEVEIRVSSVSGLKSTTELQFWNFRDENHIPPRTLRLRDYNWENPNLPLEVRLLIDERGRGELYLYGENFETNQEGLRLAKVRKEEAHSECEIFHADSNIPGLAPGQVITIVNHPVADYNTRCLITAVHISGTQPTPVLSGLGLEGGQEERDKDLLFLNQVSFRRLAVPFRPKRVCPRTKIAGSLTAWIDGAGTGADPEIDKYGRYKVILPLDISKRGGGKASTWLRMAQPYIGNSYGQNFPLTPGIEVLLTFIDGNPDRPLISGAVANAETGNIINSNMSNISAISSRGGNSIIFGEREGKQQITMAAGSDRGSFSIMSGSPTVAQLWSDSNTVLSTVNQIVSSLSSSQNSGYQHTISTSNDILAIITALITTLRSTSEAGYLAFTKGENSQTNDRVYGWMSSLQSLGINVVNILSSCQAAYELKKRLSGTLRLAKPHTNVLTLSADDGGSHATWKSKRNSTADILALCTLITSANTITKATIKAKKEVEGFGGDTEEATGIYQGKTDQTLTEQGVYLKKQSQIASLGADIKDVITNLFSLGTSIISMKGETPQNKGIFINNSDSYVNIRAKEYASLSSEKMVIIESSPQIWGDLLRTSIYEDQLKTDLFAGEVLNFAPPGKFTEAEGIILRSQLVRTLAQEISLIAVANVIKASKNIHLIVGEATPKVNVGVGALPDYNDIITNSGKEFPDIEGIETKDGIFLKTGEANQCIELHTENADSDILLYQGNADKDQARRIELQKSSIGLFVDNQVSTTMTTGGPFKIESKVKNSTFSILDDSMNLKTDNGISLEVTNKKLSVTPQGIKMDADIVQINGKSILTLD
ncbi:MAG: type VI secretion system tip protein VgrG [Deltaproteobacteria bacterium]|nr:type VI secretion system tip protein VgrG [Deltaproteobacteria bacterium]